MVKIWIIHIRNHITFLNVGDNMLRTAIEIGVIASTIFLGGCVTTVDYGYQYDMIRVHDAPRIYRYAYVPKPIPRRIYYYNRLWYDEPSTIVVRSRTDRTRVPNSELRNHFNRMPKRDVSKELREMQRKKNEKLLNKRRNPNESTRLKRDSKRTEDIQRGNSKRRRSRSRRRPSSGNDSGKDGNRVRVHDGDNS